YERWFTGVATLFVEKGVITREELEARAGGRFPLARPAAQVEPFAAAARAQPRFAPGDRVRVRDIHPAGHTRVPRYVRGKRGTLLRARPAFEFPDLAGHAHAAHLEHTCLVEFDARELWTDAAESAESVVVDLWESYLEEAK